MRAWLARWLDLRPEEVRTVALSFSGAFLVIAFLILGRSLREAFYLTSFPVETLPYITAAVALLSVPAVALFARQLARGDPLRVMVRLLLFLALGLAALWPVVTRSGPAVVAFYLWTALGTLLLTSGFWLVTAELFPVRGAKRLFGLIGAGGTAGAMVMGNSLAWLTGRLELSVFLPVLIGLLLLFLLTLLGLPQVEHETATAVEEARRSSIRESFGLAWRTPHLRTIALIVGTATIASTLVDYQFKELARAAFTTREPLAGFLGAFYGWTGAASLAIQVLLSARLMASTGLAATLSFLPLILLLGSTALLVAPGLAVATLVRGGDNSLRKSLHRSVLEVLYVPIPAALRRKTKTFIDSVADSAAEGVGAGIVFLVVTFGGLPSRLLSVFALAFALYFLWLARRAGRSYMTTVTSQLRAGADEVAVGADQRDLLSGSFTRVDLRPALEEAGVFMATADLTADAGRASAIVDDLRKTMVVEAGRARAPAPAADGPPPRDGADGRAAREPAARLRGTGEEILDALDRGGGWAEAQVPELVRLLARDSVYRRVTEVLAGMESEALRYLAGLLADEHTDFVVRRRIPGVLARYASGEAELALLGGLTAPRFEVRYRSAIALVHRRRRGRDTRTPGADERVWRAIRRETSRERPVWELQRLLDDDPTGDDLVAERVEARGELSLEHTFRLLSLVLEADAVRSAYQGILLGDDRLRSLALEYLDQVLPDDVRERLWPFIGDLSDHQRSRRERPLRDVVSDLVTTGDTLFMSERDRGALRRLLGEEEE